MFWVTTELTVGQERPKQSTNSLQDSGCPYNYCFDLRTIHISAFF